MHPHLGVHIPPVKLHNCTIKYVPTPRSAYSSSKATQYVSHDIGVHIFPIKPIYMF